MEWMQVFNDCSFWHKKDTYGPQHSHWATYNTQFFAVCTNTRSLVLTKHAGGKGIAPIQNTQFGLVSEEKERENVFRVSPLALSSSRMATVVLPWRVAASWLSAADTSTGRVLATRAFLLSLGPTGVDVLPIGCILHQRDMVVSWQCEVWDAAHQPPQVLPVGVQGYLLHASYIEISIDV